MLEIQIFPPLLFRTDFPRIQKTSICTQFSCLLIHYNVEWRYCTSRPGVPLETYVKLWYQKLKLKLWAVENWKTNEVNPCAHVVENLVSKRDPKIARNLRISCENQDFPSPKLQFSSLKIQFSSTAFQFWEIQENLLQRLSDFFNAFLLSVTAF